MPSSVPIWLLSEQRPYAVGLTGGIGCGKSLAAAMFERLGAAVIDTDAIARELTRPGSPALDAIARELGPQFLRPDGSLDRAGLRAAAFSDAATKTTLEAILHPAIRARARARLEAARAPYAVLVVPLLFETGGYADLVERTVVVDCLDTQQVARVMARSRLSEAEVRAVMAHQFGREERLARADDVLENFSTPGQLLRQVKALDQTYRRAAGRRPGGAAGARFPSDAPCFKIAPFAGFPGALPPVISYEYPLQERVRTLLRLEDLYDKAHFFIARDDPTEHHVALLTLFDLVEIAGRADLKADLLQELERQRQTLEGLRGNPAIVEETLQAVLTKLEETLFSLRDAPGKIGQHIRDNEWLMSIKQRTAIPGGVCEFDLPSYHYWLNRPAEERSLELSGWLAPMLPIYDAIGIVLRHLRESSRPVRCVARGGVFQEMLSGKTAQMLRVEVPADYACTPETSANKYAINIRFTTVGTAQRPQPFEGTVEFELTYCNL